MGDSIKFDGGEALEGRLREISANLEKGATLSVGFLPDATYPDGTPVALVAAMNEFGSGDGTRPPRPFFRNMIADKSGEWPEAIGEALTASDYDARQALGLVGEGIKQDLQQAIIDYSGPPLNPKTIARKGFDAQLRDSGHMLNSVGTVVDDQ